MNYTRRQVLAAGAAATAAAAAAGAAARASATPTAADVADVVIVGGGLSGLAALSQARSLGHTAVLLEARERAGGRVHNVRSTGDSFDLDGGAEFIGPTQTKIAAVAAAMNVVTVPTYNTGDNIFFENHTRTRFPSALPLPPVIGAAEAGLALLQLDSLASTFPVGEPWKFRDAQAWDALTWEQWVRQHSYTPSGKLLLEVAESAALSVRPHQLSALYMLNYIAAAGDEKNPGTIERLISVAGGAQEKLFAGGAALIPLRWAQRQASDIVYQAPVSEIRQVGDRYEVQTARGVFSGKRVIVAMSPAITSQISFSPALPPRRAALASGYRMGHIAKFVASYRSPFWRRAGLTGQVYGDGLPIDVTFESATAGKHFLMGFISADAILALDSAAPDDFAEHCLSSFVDYFGPQARSELLDWGFHRWDNDPYSWGGPVAVTMPGTLTRYGSALRAPVGGIHWAGTETSDYWTGYMDGAVRSGYRAATEVHRALAG